MLQKQEPLSRPGRPTDALTKPLTNLLMRARPRFARQNKRKNGLHGDNGLRPQLDHKNMTMGEGAMILGGLIALATPTMAAARTQDDTGDMKSGVVKGGMAVVANGKASKNKTKKDGGSSATPDGKQDNSKANEEKITSENTNHDNRDDGADNNHQQEGKTGEQDDNRRKEKNEDSDTWTEWLGVVPVVPRSGDAPAAPWLLDGKQMMTTMPSSTILLAQNNKLFFYDNISAENTPAAISVFGTDTGLGNGLGNGIAGAGAITLNKQIEKNIENQTEYRNLVANNLAVSSPPQNVAKEDEEEEEDNQVVPPATHQLQKITLSHGYIVINDDPAAPNIQLYDVVQWLDIATWVYNAGYKVTINHGATLLVYNNDLGDFLASLEKNMTIDSGGAADGFVGLSEGASLLQSQLQLLQGANLDHRVIQNVNGRFYFLNLEDGMFDSLVDDRLLPPALLNGPQPAIALPLLHNIPDDFAII